MLERVGERAPSSLYDLQRSVGRNLSGKERKFIYLTRATRGVPKTRDFTKDFSKEFGKSKVLGLGSVNDTS